jgi:23S rRNA pseudouridine1911/1915/1917 synthase
MRSAVPAELDGERADLVVARLLDLSRAAARSLIESGDARVDGAAVAARTRLRTGQVVDAERPPAEPDLLAEEVPFGVVYEDAFLAVVDKPAGIVVHPGAGRSAGTLAAGILARWPSVEGVGDQGRWGIVHRLDRDTSGLIVVALDERTLGRLRAELNARRIERSYLALVNGADVPPSGTVDAPLGRDPRHPTRFRVDRDGRPARTHYRRVAVWREPDTALLEVSLETGRTHQIRVHLGSIRHPVVGDRVYGRGGEQVSPRTFLHAARLAFDHPITGDPLEVHSPLPGDLSDVLGGFGEPDEGALPAGRVP